MLRGLLGAGTLVTVSGLTGCGFALRETPKFAFDAVRVAGSENSSVTRALRSVLETSGVRTYGTARPGNPPAGATMVLLTVMVDQRERAVVGQTATGEVRELQIRTRYAFRLSTMAGKTLIEDVEILLEGDISFSETAALSKAAEQEMMFQDQQAEIVQQVLRRLSAVQTL
jgi:LPS-assembly lipoprotein